MSQFDQQFYANGIMNEQQLNQLSNALYSYCKVMRVPRVGAVPVVVTVLVGVMITLILAALGESLGTAALIGAPVSVVFALLCCLIYRFRSGAAKRLNAYLAADGGQSMFIDFGWAQPFADDQFRLGRYFLFIRNGAVVRLDSITDIVRVACRSGVGVSVTVKDENDSMSLTLCGVHRLNDRAEIDEIRKAVLQRQ